MFVTIIVTTMTYINAIVQYCKHAKLLKEIPVSFLLIIGVKKWQNVSLDQNEDSHGVQLK